MTELSPDFDTIFVRRNLTGRPSFKPMPFSRYKTEFPNTNFYDDCHDIYKQLLKAEERARKFDQINLHSSVWLSSSVGQVHPLLTRAGNVADAIHAEALLIPVIWTRFVTGKYKLTPVLEGYYSKEQIDYRPLFIPGECEETERAFMSLMERKDDDLARAQARVDELSGR